MLVFSIIGTLIGAGFASGQEMYLFFYRFGLNGILGLILCSTLIFVVIYKTFMIVHTKNIYNEIIDTINTDKGYLEHILIGKENI